MAQQSSQADEVIPVAEEAGEESLLTVVVAGLANLAIAIAKAVGGVISGSAAMFGEAAHSVADTVTEILLLIAIRRGNKPADSRHPFGHGRESYLWALLASLATFVAGAGVSILEGIEKIVHGGEPGSPVVSFVVLGAAFVIESISLARALQQIRSSARLWRTGPATFLKATTDTTIKAVTFEDSAALVGLAIAALGLGLTEATGSTVWDGIASCLIGVLLVGVAVILARVNSSLLIGRAASPALERALRQDLLDLPQVSSVPFLVTSVLGPGQLLVAAKVEFGDDCTADDIERIADEAERLFVERFPGVRHVFLDPTAG
jgi:cation diffusion facilitator family transporter